MDLNKLQRELLAVARGQTPSAEVPPGFARRVIARLSAVPVMDHWGFWAQALWRAAAPCVAIMLLFAIWSFMRGPEAPSGSDLSQQFESTVLAASGLDQPPVDYLR
jgi:hypothetical protein